MRTPELLRAVAAGSLSGIVVGTVVGGLGARLVMRLSAIAAGSSAQGITTSNGNRVGEITLGGTIGLVLFAGVFAGLVGGLLYASMGPWLARFGRWRGLVFGVGLLGLAGSLILDAANSDFIILRPPLLNIVMFSALFLIFGIALVPVFDRTLHALAGSSLFSSALTLLGSAIAVLFLGSGLLSGLSALASAPTSAELITLLVFVMVAAGLATRALASRLASPPWRLLAYGILAAALLVGAATTLSSVVRIVS